MMVRKNGICRLVGQVLMKSTIENVNNIGHASTQKDVRIFESINSANNSQDVLMFMLNC